MALLTTIGLIGLSIVVGTSLFLFKKRTKESFRSENEKKEVITFTLRGLNDVDMISETINRGNVVILGVKDLARIDVIRLKRSIQQLKSHVRTSGGEIFMLGKEFIVVVPPTMKLSFIKNIIESTNQNESKPPQPPSEADFL